MIYLALSIVASTLLFVAFKLFERFKINTLHAIVFNYFTACACGLLLYDAPIQVSKITQAPWFYYTLVLGCLFILVFNLMAITTQRSGLSVVSVATKMSLVIPIVFGLLYYNESLGLFKAIGISLSLVAVYLASIKAKNGLKIQPKNLIFPVLVFFGSGIIDTSIKFLEDTYVAQNDVPLFSATVFAAAATAGVLLLATLALLGKFKFQIKNIIAGICLGIPNYFSLYFLVLALRSDLFESSGIFTINNVLIVVISTFTGILLFKERLQAKNWLGIILAIIGIALIAFEKMH